MNSGYASQFDASPIESPDLEGLISPRESAPVTQAGRRQLHGLIWPFVVAIVLLAGFSLVSLEALMALRAYGFGENVWVKNQKTAAFQLMRYAQTGDMAALERHDHAMQRLAAFKRGRELMLETPPDEDAAARFLTDAGAPAADVAQGLWAHRWFGWVSPFQQILGLWTKADHIVLEFVPMRAAVVQAHASGDIAARARLFDEIDQLDRTVMPVSWQYSSELASITHSLYLALIGIGFLLTVVLVLAIVWRTHGLWRTGQDAHRQLATERRRAAITLASIGDAVITTDPRGMVTYMNHAAQRMCLQPLETAYKSGPSWTLRLEDPHSGAESQPAMLAMETESAVVQSESEQWLRRADGSTVPVAWIASPIVDQGQVEGAVVVLRDTTRERQMVQRLSWMATHDPLTRLPNRREFEARLRAAMKRLQGELVDGSATQHVAMLLDLDQFKIVNDTCGHAAGDELLRLVTHAARKCLREQDTLARMGGDEFGVLLLNCPPSVGERKAEELRAAIREVQLCWGERDFDISASIGLIHVRPEHQEVSTVLSAADMACYVAKDRGRNQVSVYQPGDRSFAERFGDMTWPQRLRSAMAQGRFMLYVQPLMTLQATTDRAHRCEILLRLRDENGELVPPSTFITAAERYGMMPMIDRWVVDQALQTISRRQLGEDDASVLYSINLSGSAFGDDGFLAEVQAMFDVHGVRYERVCFEVTETQAIADVSAAARFIGVLRARGASFALDDFGSGMSSMGYLKHLPVDYLKIDGKLVKDMVSDPVNRAMVEMVSRLAQTLGMRTVGEFAEDSTIIDALRGVGVDFAQGYGVAHPAPFMSTPRRPAPTAQLHLV